MRTEEEKILRRIPLETLVVALFAAGAALLFFSPQTSLFILAGGLFSAWNFLWLKRALTRILNPDKRKAVRSSVALYFVRLLLITAVFLIIILLIPRMILAFAAGFSTIILVFMAEAVRGFSRLKKWKS
ncbi:MAG: ATP synthase subunit I [Acidobacteriota bacterium]